MLQMLAGIDQVDSNTVASLHTCIVIRTHKFDTESCPDLDLYNSLLMKKVFFYNVILHITDVIVGNYSKK